MRPCIQAATPEMAPVAACLIYLTMGKMADHLFGAENPRRAQDVLARLFEAETNRFSFQFAEAAFLSGEVAGLVISYSGPTTRSLEIPTARRLIKSSGVLPFGRFMVRALPLMTSKSRKTTSTSSAISRSYPRIKVPGWGNNSWSRPRRQPRNKASTRCL